jgi:splicing factor 3B subunit 2
MTDETGMTEEKFFNNLDLSLKSRSEKKRMEYINNLKEKRHSKKKQKRKMKKEINPENDVDNEKQTLHINNDIHDFIREENIEIEYVDEDPNTKSKIFEDFKTVFDYFKIPKKEKKADFDEDDNELDGKPMDNNIIPQGNNTLGQNFFSEESKETKFLSKKKRKLLKRMKISELKQMASKPETVEAWDVTSADPILLVTLKSIKNSVPVPKHWCQKRKFLQNKRGILKQPFKLPDYIESTGISKIRDHITGDRKSLKQKMREKMQPKLGKMDIDYQVLHDAFFKYQTKPKLTIHGDVYYENKEYEVKMRIYKPGRISEKLRVALGISENSPPPWIINMQRFGPPPAYPNLKIPGVNAPICDPTAEITPNLWTPPPNENAGELLYGNKGKIEHWGDLREEEEEEMFNEGNEMSLSSDDEGRTKNSGINSVVSGMETPDVNLSKNMVGSTNSYAIGSGENVPNPNQNINTNFMDKSSYFTILEQVPKNVKENEIYGSSHGYVIPAGEGEKKEAAGTSSDKGNNTTPPVNTKTNVAEDEKGDKEKKKEKKDKDKNLKKYRL